MADKWKTIAIVFIVLFFVILTYIIYGLSLYYSELDKQNECYYDICGEYADALYDADVCYCYEYSLLGELVIAETKYMKEK